MEDVIANIPEISQNEEKQSTEFAGLVARYCNYAGMDDKTAAEFICRYYELDVSIVSPITSEIYKYYMDEFGSKSFMYHLKIRNKFDDEDWQKMPFIPQKVYDNLPSIFQLATEKFKARERDIVLTALLAVTGGMINIHGIYKKKNTYPNLFAFIIAPSASGKGVMNYAKKTGFKRKQILMESDPSKNIFISANISTAKFYEKLDKNDGVGILFESEADTVANTLKNDWGSYSYLLRQAFGFEEAALERLNKSYYLEKPRLSVILSGTPNQIHGIIQNDEDGLFNRFIYYAFKAKSKWDNESDMTGFSLDDYFNELSEEYAKIISKTMLAQKFSFTERQWDIFNGRFEKWHDEFPAFYNEERVGIIKRLGDITFRIAMILTAIRFGEQENPTETPLVLCDDIDFESAFIMAEIYKHHSLFMYAILNNNPVNNKPVDKMVQKFLDSLPSEFSKAEAIEIGKEIDIAERTVSKYLDKLLKAGHLEQPKFGRYRNAGIGETQNSTPNDSQEDVQENIREILIQEKLQDLFYMQNQMEY